MKLFIGLVVLSVFLTACSATPPEPGFLAEACQEADGNWLTAFQECEYISEETCTELGGSFDPCTSACRHDPTAEVCTEQCVPVCSFA